MRKSTWLGASLLSAALVLPALAQQPTGSTTPTTTANAAQANSFFTGVNPRDIKSSPVNPGRAMKNPNFAQALQPNATQKSTSVFNMGSMFHGVTLGSWPPKLPTFAAVKTPPLIVPPSQVPKGSVNIFGNK